METNTNGGATAQSNAGQGIASLTKEIQQGLSTDKNVTKKLTLACNIRLKKGLVAIPNQSPEEFNYYFESILAPSGGPLKGVTGTLERLIMPSIIDVSTNDNTFNSHIKDYWANFSNVLPPDSDNKRDIEQGIKMEIKFMLHTNAHIARYEKLTRIDDQFRFIHDLLEEQELGDKNTRYITLNSEYYSDFVKLAFALKHSRVANRAEDKDKSPKIMGYIYEKAIDFKAQENEMDIFTKFSDNLRELDDEKKANAILLAIGESVVDVDSLSDKKIIIYNLGKVSHPVRVKVNKLFSDENWMYKYYVQQGLFLQILKQPVNSKLIQYGDAIIGNDLESAATHLKTTAEGGTLLHIIKSKLEINT